MPEIEPGTVIGRYTVVREGPRRRQGNSSQRRPTTVVQCRCEEEFVVFTSDLRRRRTSGCRQQSCRMDWEREKAAKKAAARTIKAEREAAEKEKALMAEAYEGLMLQQQKEAENRVLKERRDAERRLQGRIVEMVQGVA